MVEYKDGVPYKFSPSEIPSIFPNIELKNNIYDEDKERVISEVKDTIVDVFQYPPQKSIDFEDLLSKSDIPAEVHAVFCFEGSEDACIFIKRQYIPFHVNISTPKELLTLQFLIRNVLFKECQLRVLSVAFVYKNILEVMFADEDDNSSLDVPQVLQAALFCDDPLSDFIDLNLESVKSLIREEMEYLGGSE